MANTKLAKSVRVYRAMLARLPRLGCGAGNLNAYRDCADYLRALYIEFGRDNVRREIEAGREA